tara:strand:- start:17 stop:178 length:162 start_codon:yes stop_codon:yes gene_type:complete
MRSKQMLRNLKQALKQDYLYNTEELSFMREQLAILEEEVLKSKRKKPEGFGKK